MYAVPITHKATATRMRRVRQAGAGSAPVRKYSRTNPKSPVASRRQLPNRDHVRLPTQKCHSITAIRIAPCFWVCRSNNSSRDQVPLSARSFVKYLRDPDLSNWKGVVMVSSYRRLSPAYQ